jgi:hypothetical protein
MLAASQSKEEPMRIRVLAISLMVGFTAAVVPVLTVTNGQPDGTRHPYAGIAVQDIPSQPGFVFVCSGSALSSTRFLTAAHCFDPALPVRVSYKSGPPFAGTFTEGKFHPDPAWCLGCGPGLPGFDTHDVAVITLSAPVNPGAFAALPEPALVDTLPMKTSVEIVGLAFRDSFAAEGDRRVCSRRSDSLPRAC